MKDNYSTRELAEILSVNESTVKRWADIGYIECARTKGGHRKFPIRSVLRFVHENRLNVPALSRDEFDRKDVQAHLSAGFVDVLVPSLRHAALEGDPGETLRIMRAALVSQPDIILFYSQLVFPVLIEIGTDWENGLLGVDAEHLATQAIKSAVYRLQSDIHIKRANGLTAVVGCFQGEVHDIAISCVGSYLTSEGWNVYLLGQDVPSADLANFIQSKNTDLVAVSAVVVTDERKFVYDINNKIIPAAKKAGAVSVVGGPRIPADFSGRLKCDLLSDNIADIKPLHEKLTSKRTRNRN